MSKKRRKISEIAEEMFEIINQKPTKEELEELAEVLNEENSDGEYDSFPEEKIASSYNDKENVDGHESSRI
ncbi:MAG: hypothetical protein CMJ16_08910 [Peredibacter sp.]|nr:hypothetical protein [Peredibacter sp.]